jgi:hypothetical protein
MEEQIFEAELIDAFTQLEKVMKSKPDNTRVVVKLTCFQGNGIITDFQGINSIEINTANSRKIQIADESIS